MRNSRPSLSARFTSTQGSCLITLICLQFLWSFCKTLHKKRKNLHKTLKISTKNLHKSRLNPKNSSNPADFCGDFRVLWIFSKNPGFNRSFNKNILYYYFILLLYIFLLIYLLTYLSPLNFLFYNTYKEITTLNPQKYKISPIFRDLKFSPRKISTKIKNFEEFLIIISNEISPFYKSTKDASGFFNLRNENIPALKHVSLQVAPTLRNSISQSYCQSFRGQT